MCVMCVQDVIRNVKTGILTGIVTTKEIIITVEVITITMIKDAFSNPPLCI